MYRIRQNDIVEIKDEYKDSYRNNSLVVEAQFRGKIFNVEQDWCSTGFFADVVFEDGENYTEIFKIPTEKLNYVHPDKTPEEVEAEIQAIKDLEEEEITLKEKAKMFDEISDMVFRSCSISSYFEDEPVIEYVFADEELLEKIVDVFIKNDSVRERGVEKTLRERGLMQIDPTINPDKVEDYSW